MKTQNKKYKVIIKIGSSEEEKTFILDYRELEHLKNEIRGNNRVMWEYETEDKEIITDDMIREIIKIEKIKNKTAEEIIKESEISKEDRAELNLSKVVNGKVARLRR